ncbi:hypothetical protein DL96DRAFT_1808678 [Flagelloscypha sp. PMI_526]|nr:hypothetical protein DL96DRAFT_1808678 [Flagelloscypha sp. PMI_526]
MSSGAEPYDLAAFALTTLTTRTTIRMAVDGLTTFLERCPNDTIRSSLLRELVRDLVTQDGLHPLALPTILSGVPLFANYVLLNFPETLSSYFTSPLPLFLDTLSTSCLAIECKPGLDAAVLYRSVAGAKRILETLHNFNLDLLDYREPSDEPQDDEDFGEFLVRKKRGKTKSKTKTRIVTRLDPRPFEEFDEKVPHSKADALLLIAEQLSYLAQYILPEYIRSLSQLHVREHLYNLILPVVPVQTSNNSPSKPLSPTSSAQENPHLRADYPLTIHPLKAAVHFDGIDDWGDWEIYISTAAQKDLAEARRTDRKRFKIYVKKIRELSFGMFSDDNQKRLTHVKAAVPIYEAKMTADSRLVYQVHCVAVDEKTERQALRIFGIYTHTQLERLPVNSLGTQLATFGREYRRRCNFRNLPANPGDYVVSPASFPPSIDDVKEEDHMPQLPKEDWDVIHTLLVTEKFIPFSKDFLKGIIADLDATHMFAVTPQEREIIEHMYSCYVIGRSGTGKTTTMLFKMFGIEKAYELHRKLAPISQKPRQVFVTKSRVLAGKVQEVYDKLKQSLLTTGKSEKELMEMAANKQSKKDDGGMIDEEDKDYRADLPGRFSLLRDEHFPLFITFDRLCTLLENDISYSLQQPPLKDHGLSWSPTSPTTSHSSEVNTDASGALLGFSGSFINFDIFRRDYWPHFSQNLTKGLSEILVYNEIMGVLKGSEDACRAKNRYLERSAYEGLSQRAQWTFATQRGAVYNLFEQYLKKKRSQGDFDAADRTHYILRMLEDGRLKGHNIDFLYVDEAQDNLMIDALLLRFLCRNPNGLFWAGDTAQTISVGSSFRFSDLKAFMWRQEQRDRQSGFFKLQEKQPKTFQLTTNYRSHAGIVSCAYSVISIISKFWSNSLDALAPEKGVVEGEKPVFFSGWDEKSARYEQFLFNSSSGSYMEFGARQCILVRNDEARKRLRAQVGTDIGLIMTLYESKGLEFDDVLLYNFFEDSSVELAQWRVVLNVLVETKPSVTPPRFNETLHAGVCNELKFLYVAITRARKNAWIVDKSDKGEPMREVWTALGNIQNCTPDTDVPRLQVSSTPEEWKEQGSNLFKNRLWLQAMHCFDRAGLKREAFIAKAYYLRDQAREIPRSNSSQQISKRKGAFESTAEAFLECAALHGNTAKESEAYFKAAGDSFKEVENLVGAAKAYISAKEYNLAAPLYRKAGCFDDAIEVIRLYRHKMDVRVVESILEVAKLFYFQKGDRDSLGKATHLFSDMQDALDYLDDMGLDDRRALLLESSGRAVEAAELYVSQGQIHKAVELYLSRVDEPEVIRLGQETVLNGLRQHFVFDPDLEAVRQSQDAKKFLVSARNGGLPLLSEQEQDEIKIYQAMFNKRLGDLRTLALRCIHVHKNDILSVFALDVYFRTFPSIAVIPPEEVSEVLVLFDLYTRALQRLRSLDPSTSDALQRLFSTAIIDDSSFLLAAESRLYNLIKTTRFSYDLHPEGAGYIITRDTFIGVFRHALVTRLFHRTQMLNDHCQQAEAFAAPCMTHLANGQCYQSHCTRRHHPAKTFTAEKYTAYVRLHLQEILILSRVVWPPSQRHEKTKSQRIWLERLYDALFPPFHSLGNLASLRSGLIPEGKEAFQVVKYWSQDLLRTRFSDPSIHAQALSELMRISFLSFFFDKDDAAKYIFAAPCLKRFNDEDLSRYRKGGTGIHARSSVVEAMCRALQALPNDRDCVTEGIIFVEKVAAQGLGVDINVLCDFIDFLAGILILSRSYPSGITLPQSWLIVLLKHAGRPNKETIAWRILTVATSTILDTLVLGNASYLFFNNKSLSGTERGAIKSVFIARLCRTLGIVGYNFGQGRQAGTTHNPVRAVVAKRFSSLGPPEKAPRLYQSYAITSQAWPEIARAVQRSNGDTTIDKMCELSHLSRQDLKPPPRGITRVSFSAVDESIATKLLFNASSYSALTSSIRNTSLRAEAPAFVPRALQAAAPASEDSSLNEEDEEDKQEYAKDVSELASQLPSMGKVLSDLPPTSEERRATGIVEKYIRRKLDGRKYRSNASLTHTKIDKHHRDCILAWETPQFQTALATAGNSTKKKRIFLGAVPHMLYVFQLVEEYMNRKKTANKKRFKKAAHEELEQVQKSMDEIRDLSRQHRTMKRKLETSSQFYLNPQGFQLLPEMLELERLILEEWPLPDDLKEEIAPDLQTCVWAVDASRTREIEERRKAEKAKLPELNMADGEDDRLDDMVYDEDGQEDTIDITATVNQGGLLDDTATVDQTQPPGAMPEGSRPSGLFGHLASRGQEVYTTLRWILTPDDASSRLPSNRDDGARL